MKIKILTLIILLTSSVIYADTTGCENCDKQKTVLSGYSDLLKVADYDYNNATFRMMSESACNALRDGKPELAIERFEKDGYDFIHNYAQVACEDDPNNGVMFYHLWSNDVSFKSFYKLVKYVWVRDREDNATEGLNCLYCKEIFNLKNPRGQTLLDLISEASDRAKNRGSNIDSYDRVIDLIIKLGAKTSAELDVL